MDEGFLNVVKEVFVRLYEKGFIYKGERMINWCLICYIIIFDVEVEYEEKKGKFYYIKYLVKDNLYYVVVVIIRFEIMFGDIVVVVNLND